MTTRPRSCAQSALDAASVAAKESVAITRERRREGMLANQPTGPRARDPARRSNAALGSGAGRRQEIGEAHSVEV